MIQTLCSVLILIQAQAVSAQEEVLFKEASAPETAAAEIELYQLKVTALGLGPAVVVPENLTDWSGDTGRVIEESGRHLEAADRDTRRSPNQAGMAHGRTNTGRDWSNDVWAGRRAADSQLYQHEYRNDPESKLNFCHTKAAWRCSFNLNLQGLIVPQQNRANPMNLSCRHGFSSVQFDGTLIVPAQKTIVIQASQTSNSGNEIPGHVLIFVSVEKHP